MKNQSMPESESNEGVVCMKFKFLTGFLLVMLLLGTVGYVTVSSSPNQFKIAERNMT